MPVARYGRENLAKLSFSSCRESIAMLVASHGRENNGVVNSLAFSPLLQCLWQATGVRTPITRYSASQRPRVAMPVAGTGVRTRSRVPCIQTNGMSQCPWRVTGVRTTRLQSRRWSSLLQCPWQATGVRTLRARYETGCGNCCNARGRSRAREANGSRRRSRVRDIALAGVRAIVLLPDVD